MTLPHYIILKILRIITNTLGESKSIFSFINRISLVSKEWKEVLLPKLNFEDSLHIDKKSIRYLQILLEKGLLKNFNLKILISDDTYNELSVLFQDKQFRVGVLDENEEYQTTQVTDLDIHASKFDVFELPDDFRPLHSLSFFQGSLKQVAFYLLPKWSLDRLLSFRPFKYIKDLEFNDMEIPFQLSESLKPLERLETLNLISVKITVANIISCIKQFNLTTLLLQSTPYGHSPERYDEMLSVASESTSLTSLSIFSYFMKTSTEALINLINVNLNLTRLCVCNIHRQENQNFNQKKQEIRNQTLKHLYIDNNSENFLTSWGDVSALTSVQFSDFGQIECSCVKMFHYKSLNTLSITRCTETSLICDIVSLNLSFSLLNLLGPIKFDRGALSAAISKNSKIATFYHAESDKELVMELLLLQHQPLKSLHIVTPNDEITEMEDAIIKSKHVKQLTMNTKPIEFDQTFNSLIRVIKGNFSITNLSFPASSENQMVTSEQLLILDDALNHSPLLSLHWSKNESGIKYDEDGNIENPIEPDEGLESLLSSKLIEYYNF
ncbi:hypothetical protein DLAC_01788 [Tieghemostelium lacteum]|uniref:F-box domain-containing protein n=1 Tax=Tieghemostelium lacteum TaxID=361077 RepID=A0A152A6B4_TIELA|nr:hypothetical protein DLAC_01788 [Tieghemostelium lacteum]|eukprot:KYR01776.1 hypothetical protein DLAC_01788 [Tieghemostelium lacteum]